MMPLPPGFKPAPHPEKRSVSVFLHEAIKRQGKVRGMFLNEACIFAKKNNYTPSTQKHYRAFLYYPSTELIELLFEIAENCADLETMDAQYQMGLGLFGTFKDTTLGKVVLGSLERDTRAQLKSLTRATGKLCTSLQTTEITSGEDFFHLRLEDCVYPAPRIHRRLVAWRTQGDGTQDF